MSRCHGTRSLQSGAPPGGVQRRTRGRTIASSEAETLAALYRSVQVDGWRAYCTRIRDARPGRARHHSSSRGSTVEPMAAATRRRGDGNRVHRFRLGVTGVVERGSADNVSLQSIQRSQRSQRINTDTTHDSCSG